MSEERDVLAARKAKMQSWQASVGTYPNEFRRQDLAADLLARHEADDKAALAEAQVATAVTGRIMLRRVMGKASFITLQDVSGQIQCYLAKNNLGDEAYEGFTQHWEMGDIVGVRGVLMRTNKGELSVQADEIMLLNKTLQPLPEKFHGLTDQETRYRQRYVDLISNPDSRRVFQTRSKIVHNLRQYFVERDYLEVENTYDAQHPGWGDGATFYHPSQCFGYATLLAGGTGIVSKATGRGWF